MLKQCPRCGCPMAKALVHDHYECAACGFCVDGLLRHTLCDWGLSAAVYGEDAKGGRDFGAPNLTDKIALYGSTLDQVKAQLVKPRHGVMPGWSHRLDDATIKQLAVYVHSLGGGEAAVPATQ